MRKHAKKLKLAKETLRDLEGRDVQGVAGGTYTRPLSACNCYPGDYSYYCPSVRVVCKDPTF